MRRAFIALLTLLVLGVLFALVGGSASHTPQAQAGRLGIDDELSEIQEHLISGFAAYSLGANAENNGLGGAQSPTTYFPRGSGACPTNQSSNVKVNQNCINLSDPDLQGRGQAQNETSIKVDPNQSNHVIASYNDYRRGDGTCGVTYSLDSGRTWNESTVPNNFVRGTFVAKAREYYQGGGDTSVDWDSKGNAYLSCQMFKRGSGVSPDLDQSNGLYVFRSTQNFGASWNFPARPVVESRNTSGNFLPLEDKQLMAIDNNATACAGSPATATPGGSCTPFQDRIYVTWTEFRSDGSAFIWESHSSNYGESFSARHLVSRNNAALCTNNYGAGTVAITGEVSQCNENQFSQPFVGPDGVLYVVFANFNNPETLGGADNRNQILVSRSFDGGSTFEFPHKVADYYDLPDCATYQAGHDFGRACVPEKGPTTNSYFRATNYPAGAVNPTSPGEVVVTVGSYINQHSKESNGCIPTGLDVNTGLNLYTGVKTAGACNNDIVVSTSTNGGTTFTGTSTNPRALATANTDAGQATSDQWFQWVAYTKNGKLATSYYDRQYGTDETTGYSDVSVSSSGDAPAYAGWNVQRATSSSMPIPTQFPDGGGFSTFWGDYAGLSADTQAHPFWSDTRDPELIVCPATTPPAVCGAQNSSGATLNDQNAYTANTAVPNSK